MKFTICIVALAIMVSVEAIPAPVPEKDDYLITAPTNGKEYFEGPLHEIQGAITDTLAAGRDLELMEDSLQNIVNDSSYFWRTESATEYATSSKPYKNGWTE